MSHRRKILIVVVVVLGATILIPVIHHYQLRAATEAYIAKLKANGEPMELAQVIPPPVPPEQNSAGVFRSAASLIDTDQSLSYTNYAYGMEMVAPGKAMIRWQQPDNRDYDGTNSWEDVASAVAQNSKSFELLHQIIEKPNFDFQIKYEQGIDGLNFTNLYLAESRGAALRLATATLCDLHYGDTASAVKNLRAMLALVKAMRDERFIISELVRMAIASIALDVNWELLQSPNLTDEQLAQLQHDWVDLEFIQAEENALAMERVTGEMTFTKWRKSNSALQSYINHWLTLPELSRKINILDRAKLGTQIFRWRYWWSYPDELQLMEGYQILLDAVRFAETNYSLQTALHDQSYKMQKLNIDTNSAGSLYFSDASRIDLHSMMSGDVFSLSIFLKRAMRAETTKQMTITVIALKRYQLKHGNYPTNLNSLVPEFVSAVPLDPVDGQPLRYRRNADGTFLLYSVGENGKDDGGDPKPSPDNPQLSYWQFGQDWVWPQPATAEEIQKYYDEQARKSK
jgi:hypothetical protein